MKVRIGDILGFDDAEIIEVEEIKETNKEKEITKNDNAENKIKI